MKKLLLIALTLLSVEALRSNAQEKFYKEFEQKMQALERKIQEITSSLDFKNNVDRCQSANELFTAINGNANDTLNHCARATLVRMLPDEYAVLFFEAGDKQLERLVTAHTVIGLNQTGCLNEKADTLVKQADEAMKQMMKS